MIRGRHINRMWRSRAVRGVLYQVAAAVAIALLAWFIVGNTLENMRARGIQSGFEFLTQTAGFEIGESALDYDASHSYGRAFVVGLGNTLRVAVAGIALATVLGTLIGIGRLSANFLVRALCAAYVEVFRNVPLLVQLFMWYFVVTALLPPAGNALQPFAGVYLSQSGLQFPIPAGSLADWLAPGVPFAIDWPQPAEFNISGGGALTPEYMTLLAGLTLYTAAFIAEIVRGGIQSVPVGQAHAAHALGLNRGHTLRRVVLPQALRVIVPPVTSQYLNLTKNSSLAVAIGYPDLVSVSNTILNQTGRAVECILIIMAVYLTLSLLTATLMNWYNSRVAIRER